LRIEELVNRYLKNAAKPAWADQWAKMYDQQGVPRYVIALLHVGSNLLGRSSTPDSTFAQGFDWVANKVLQDTGINVGFTLDMIPAEDMIPVDSRDPDLPVFRATPELTGSYLVQHASVLAIQAFIPEIYTGICSLVLHPGADCDQVAGSPALDHLITWKRDFIQRWVATNIPVILDVAPGYDAQKIFPETNIRYGNNDPWRKAQADFLSLGIVGLAGNTWNGYTEGYAIVPSCGTPPGLLCPPDNPAEPDVTYKWFHDLRPPGGSPARLPTALSGIGLSSGSSSDPVTLTARLTEALSGASIANRTVHFQLGTQGTNGIKYPTISFLTQQC